METELALILISFCIYCLLSYILHRNPHLIGYAKPRKVPLSSTRVHHISHRGGAGENLENTMNAFDHAMRLGTDVFEVDCHFTNDGYVVVVHDDHLLRLCGEDIRISETNFHDLPPLLCSQRLDFNNKFVVTKSIPIEQRKILLLEDLFAKYPKISINIDIKVNNAKLIKAVGRLIVKYKREHLTIWGNGSHTTSTSIRSANPDVNKLYSRAEVLKTLAFYYTGILPFVPVYAGYFEIPLYSLYLEHSDTFPEKAGTQYRKIVVKITDSLLTNRKMILHLKKRGVQTYFYVLNSEHEWRRAVDCGASGIMTDFPQKLQLWLRRNSIAA